MGGPKALKLFSEANGPVDHSSSTPDDTSSHAHGLHMDLYVPLVMGIQLYSSTCIFVICRDWELSATN